MAIFYHQTSLKKMITSFSLLNRQSKKLARFAMIDALRRTQTHVRKEVEKVERLKVSSIKRRSHIIAPHAKGSAFEGALVYAENAPPLASAFKGFRWIKLGKTPTGRSRRGRYGVRVQFRTDESPTFFTASWARVGSPGFGHRADAADIKAARDTFPTIRGRSGAQASGRVGRMPYFALYGPSPIGLLEDRPEFGKNAQTFLINELQRQTQTRYDRMMQAQTTGKDYA